MTKEELENRVTELEKENAALRQQAIANARAYHEVNANFSALQVQKADEELAKMQQAAAAEVIATETVA